jgi:hypothetical protein
MFGSYATIAASIPIVASQLSTAIGLSACLGVELIRAVPCGPSDVAYTAAFLGEPGVGVADLSGYPQGERVERQETVPYLI